MGIFRTREMSIRRAEDQNVAFFSGSSILCSQDARRFSENRMRRCAVADLARFFQVTGGQILSLPRSVVGCRLSVVGCRWSVVGVRCSVFGGRCSVVGGRWSVVGCRWSVVGGRGRAGPPWSDHFSDLQ